MNFPVLAIRPTRKMKIEEVIEQVQELGSLLTTLLINLVIKLTPLMGKALSCFAPLVGSMTFQIRAIAGTRNFCQAVLAAALGTNQPFQGRTVSFAFLFLTVNALCHGLTLFFQKADPFEQGPLS